LPLNPSVRAGSAACWSTVCCADGASFLRPNTRTEYLAAGNGSHAGANRCLKQLM
jgi:hypothetical protein